MLATPRYHGLVSGTVAICGTAITSPASASRISHRSLAQAMPRRDCSTCAAVFAASRVASSCWNARRLSFAARAIESLARKSAERGDLREQLVALHRFHDVVPGTLPQPPDLVRLLGLGRAQDDRYGARRGVPADCPRCLEAVESRHDDVHEDQDGCDRPRLRDRTPLVA